MRRVIPRAAVLVNLVRFRGRDLETDSLQPAHYAAWVVPPAGEGEVSLVDLGDAATIDQAVLGVRRSLVDETTRSNPAVADPALSENLAKLSELVYQPLAPTIESTRDWMISPDGALWLVPWAALPVEKGTYALERHTIRYLISGRELVADADRAKSQQPGLALADPDFDAEPAGKAPAQGDAADQTPPALAAATRRGGPRPDCRLTGPACPAPPAS